MDQPINILIVDDQPSNLTVLESVLDDPGHRLVRAGSADEALLALVVEEFALLILDIRMPGTSGVELAQIIKERRKSAQVPIIFLTAHYNQDDQVLAGYDSGAVDYLQKPVNPSILRSKVAVFAALHRSSRALLAEIIVRRHAEEQLRGLTAGLEQRVTERTEALSLATSANTALELEIVRREAVELALKTSQQTTMELYEKSRHLHEELRLLSRQLLTVQEEERRRISRELHDVIAQTLTGINVQLAALKSETTATIDELRAKIASTQLIVEKSVDIVHRFARELRPAMLDDLGLIPALQSYLTSYIADTGIRVTLTAFAGVEAAGGSVRTVLYRVALEALTNVARHAKASRAEVIIEDIADLIRMEIKDDGQGFAVEGKTCAVKTNRLGLLGMRERVEMVGGTFCVDSAPGSPTTIRVEIPSALSSASLKTANTTSLECI